MCLYLETLIAKAKNTRQEEVVQKLKEVINSHFARIQVFTAILVSDTKTALQNIKGQIRAFYGKVLD